MRPAVQVSIASSNRSARRYSSASAAKAMDAGSDWTRRFNSSMRGESAITAFYSGAIVLFTATDVFPVSSVTVRVTT